MFRKCISLQAQAMSWAGIRLLHLGPRQLWPLVRMSLLCSKAPELQCQSLLDMLVNQSRFDHAEELLNRAANLLPDNRFIRIYRDSVPHLRQGSLQGKVVIHLVTMPRSGTMYCAKMFQWTGRFSFASAIRRDIERRLDEDCTTPLYASNIYFCPAEDQGRYLLKSHFFNADPAPGLLAPDCHRVNQISFPLDALFSWSHLRSRAFGGVMEDKYGGYRLRSGNPEWNYIREHLGTMRSWLQGLGPEDILRYEDYMDLEHPNILALARCADLPPNILFRMFKPDASRLYYLDDSGFAEMLAQRFDRDVLTCIMDHVGDAITRFYPEMLPRLNAFLG